MKKRLVLIAVVIMAIVAVTMIYQTYATSSSVSSNNNVHTITLKGSTQQVTIPANSSKTVIYQITNTNKGVVQYGIAYKGDNITARVYNTSEAPASGTIDYGENKFVKLYITNTSDSSSVATIETVLGYENGGKLVLPSGYSFVSSEYYPLAGAAEEITQLYLNNKNKVVTNNSIEYQYAESVNLMNDRLGGTTSDYDAGNVRYYGTNPNNYVDIGDRTSDGKVIPYRIIGVFKDIETSDGSLKQLIKVIRADSIGTYAWDNKTSGIGSSVDDDGSNDWSDARLMMLLNPGYDKDAQGNEYSSTNPLKDASGDIIYGYEGSLWWNSKSGTCYSDSSNGTKTCDFTSTGLSSDAHNKIEEVVWNLGGNSTASVYSDVMYTAERGTTVYTGRPIEWEGKVALMYPSDYGYATDFNVCSSLINNYNLSGCSDKDWLFLSQYNIWQLTTNSLSSYTVFQVWGSKVVGSDFVYYSKTVFPVFYLNSELVIESGNGTIDNPYKLSEKKIYYPEVTASGTSSVQINSSGEDLVGYKIYGNSVQDGTPTPEDSIEVMSVGDKTYNLFNVSNDLNFTQYYELNQNIPAGTYKIICDDFSSVKSDGSIGKIYLQFDGTNTGVYLKNNTTITLSTNATIIHFYGYGYNYLGSAGYKVNIKNLMLVPASATITGYEPYGYKIPVKVSNSTDEITTNIYLSDPLRKIGDFADYIDFKNGIVYRNVGKHIFNGVDEFWSKYNNAFYTTAIDGKAKSVTSNIFNTHYSPSEVINSSNLADKTTYIGSGSGMYYIRDNDYADVSAFKSYLQSQNSKGTPVTLFYPLVSEDGTETIELPNIPTLKGDVKIEVATEVKPSNIEITYKGK